MTMDEERKKIYASTREDLLVRQLSNSERFDNAILTLSTGVLGISLAFIKDIVPLEKAVNITLLKTSWWFFGAAIISTLLSFVTSQLGINTQLKYAERYYLDSKDEFLNKVNIPARATDYLNYAAGALFLVGILTTVWFVSINIKGGQTVANDKNQARMEEQKVVTESEKRGASIPAMQPVKPSSPSDAGQQSGQGGGSGDKK